MKKLEGKLTVHYETGMEGIMMALEDNLNLGYKSLHPLLEGDILNVYQNNEIYFTGKVTKEMSELYSIFSKLDTKIKNGIKCFTMKWRLNSSESKNEI